MKNKKGFTLIEIIVVITIIGLLATLIVPNVIRYMKKGKTDYNSKLDTELISTAKSYYSEHKEELPKGYINNNTNYPIKKTMISSIYLAGQNYLSGDFVDSEGNDCKTNSYVVIERNDNNYDYSACIKCTNGYESRKEDCNYKVDKTDKGYDNNNGDDPIDSNKLPYCTISLSSGKANEWTNEKVILKLYASSERGLSYYYLNSEKDNKKIINNNLTTYTDEIEFIDEQETSNYFIKVEDASAKYYTKCTFDGTIKIDKTRPVISNFTIKSNNSNINIKDTTVTITGTDNKSGIDKVCITTSNDSSTCKWEDTTSDTYTNNNYQTNSDTGSGKTDTLYAFVKDKAGNISDSKKVDYKLYAYCTEKTRKSAGSWSSCTASCGGGTQERTAYYTDKYNTSFNCESAVETQSCNTQACTDKCYVVDPDVGLNCRTCESTSCSSKTAFSKGTYLLYREQSSGWYYNSTYKCYSYSAYLSEVSLSNCYSSGGGGGGSSSKGITGICTCSARFYYVYDKPTPISYSCSAYGLRSSSACQTFCKNKTLSENTMVYTYISSTCSG